MTNLSDYLSRSITWNDTGDTKFPYVAVSEGTRARIRMNDFPAEPLYTLLVNDAEFDFDNWPAAWVRISLPPPQNGQACLTAK